MGVCFNIKFEVNKHIVQTFFYKTKEMKNDLSYFVRLYLWAENHSFTTIINQFITLKI